MVSSDHSQRNIAVHRIVCGINRIAQTRVIIYAADVVYKNNGIGTRPRGVVSGNATEWLDVQQQFQMCVRFISNCDRVVKL